MKTLPDSPGKNGAAAPAAGRTSPLRRILVVDDDISLCQLNVSVLARAGYQVDAAADGAAAWEILNADSYDLLITDHKMPKLTGLELLKKLRAARMALPAILISGAMPTEELRLDPRLQAELTLLKPFTPDELLGTVKKVLHATDSWEPIATSNGQSQPSTAGLRP